ncbi:uncharacterized protein LOC8065916 isoform X2 [Sorghum bicolor]|uniref:uncharacterized protein LOC8065916 isoform X2 n=1 Tax=Sorghum bicolor TaxID=4558 RepID=UPI000B425DCA|nr:uncharacterized protein LOC8065916 isoform X2 [Sorghum bicolor]|eukprot:XP_021303911.1 uncharacterized protein LOC8065916 isoform X2 [Sorghum bicolor]
MDGCSSWLPLFQGSGIGDAVSRSGSEVQQKQDLPISSQVEEQLQQFYLLMDMEKNGHPEPEVVVPSSESSIFPSFSGSPDETSSLMPWSGNDTTASNYCHHPAEVSPATYGGDRRDDHQCYGNLDTILNLDEFKCQDAHNGRAQHNNGHGGAFMPYVRHLSPKKQPNKPGSGGQRAIKAAISAVARMHMVRLAQWRQCGYQMEMAVALPTGWSNNCNQQQHVLSERKRRQKLNDSFKALRTVLPPASSKKDKASILIRARDYVSTLESRVSELEKKNRMLVELQHLRNNGGDVYDKKIELDIDIDREACAVKETSQEFHLKIMVGSECNAMDAVVSILECLKEIGDVRLVAMDAVSRATTLTLQMKSSRCNDNILKEYVIKSVKGAMKSKTETS